MNISTSIRKLTYLFVVLFIGLSGSLVYWQVVVADKVTANPHNGRNCLAENAGVRGRIFDRNGVLLADSQPDPHGLCGYTRHYYYANVPGLSAVLGYYAPGYQSFGIEAQYDDYLSGRVGMTALDNLVNKTLHNTPHGSDIYLTIDIRIEKIADKHFDDPVYTDNSSAFPTNRGSIVITNPHTGEILALVSRPGYDPNKMVQSLNEGNFDYYNQLVQDTVGRPLRDHPLQEAYPPGSTYKTVTLMAGLNYGATTLDEQFDQKHALGPITYNGHNIGPSGNNLSYVGEVGPSGYTKYFPVSTNYGFSHSDNVIFAQVAVKTGYDNWMNFNKEFYVGQKIPFDLPVTTSSVEPDGHHLNDVELASDAFGQGFDLITPLQLSLFNSTVANDGNFMKPMLVKKITDKDNNIIASYDPTSLGHPITSQTATNVRQAMYGVTFCGSGLVPRVMVNSSPWGIISKTGTAQVSDNLSIPAHSWFITEAPYSVNNPSQLPALAIVAMKENGGEGGKINGPETTSIYNDIFTQIPDYSNLKAPGVASSTYCCQAKLLQIGPGC